MTNAEKYAKRYLKNELREIETSERRNELFELSAYEKAIIFKYSNDGYENLNQGLIKRKGQNNTVFGKALKSSLNKLPSYEGVVYRGAYLTPAEVEKYQFAMDNNTSVSEHTFVSTSKSRLIAMSFGNVLFRLVSRTGKEIEKIAKFGKHNPPNELEVLFSCNKKFKVLEIKNEGSYLLITMEEV